MLELFTAGLAISIIILLYMSKRIDIGDSGRKKAVKTFFFLFVPVNALNLYLLTKILIDSIKM